MKKLKKNEQCEKYNDSISLCNKKTSIGKIQVKKFDELIENVIHVPLFNRIYEIKTEKSHMNIPESLQCDPKFSFVNDGVQKIITLINLFTYEEVLYNPIREKRPGYIYGNDDHVILDEKISKSKKNCDFCDIENRTASDPWGRIISPSRECCVASNIAKYQGYHSMIIPKQHSSIELSLSLIQDLLLTAKQWFDTVNALDSNAVYPHIMWDNLPRSSASQYHMHWQVNMRSNRYFGRTQQLYDAAERYKKIYESNLLQDIITVHETLGLAIRCNNVVAMAYITPIKEMEIMIISWSESYEIFGRMFYLALEVLFKDMNVRAISCGISLKAYNDNNYPTIARIINRGGAFDLRNDVGAMEFYGACNITNDPFVLAKALHDRFKNTTF